MKNLFVASLILFVTSSLFSQDLKKLIDKGDLETIQKIEAKGFDILQPISVEVEYPDGDFDYTEIDPIVYASGHNQIEIVRFYISKKTEIDEYSSWESALSSAFISAISTKNDDLIELLYAEKPGTDFLCELCNNHNALMVSAAYGMDKWYFILKEKSDATLKSIYGNTLLHIAVSGSSMPIIEDIIKSGNYNLNEKNVYDMTPLDFAIADSNMTTFKYLLDQGADLNQATHAWLSVAESEHMEIFYFLVKNLDHRYLFIYDNYTEWALNAAVKYNNEIMVTEMVQLMKKYIQANPTSGLDQSPLIYYEEYPILSWALFWKNKITYEAVLDLAHTMNNVYETPDYVYFEEYLRKRSKRVFGKSFADDMQEKYDIVWQE